VRRAGPSTAGIGYPVSTGALGARCPVVSLAAVDADPISRARSLADPDAARDLYDDWAATYDHDVFAALGFTGSDRIAELLAEHLPGRDRPVLDLGCGTGAVGVRLAELGFTTIDGVDLSPEMVALAATKGVYRELTVLDLTATVLDLPAGRAALVSAGTFTTGHVGPEVVPRVLDLLAPGGAVAWVIGASVWPAFAPVLKRLPLKVLHSDLEPIRRDGDAEGVMYVARYQSRD
jgi:predicted TPR repeat methyltransferase